MTAFLVPFLRAVDRENHGLYVLGGLDIGEMGS